MSNDNGESIDIQLNVPATKQGGQPTQSQKDENPRTLPQNPACPSPLTLPQQLPASETQDSFAEIFMNKALYDPPRWGWTALGGIADVLSPHERSRRHSTCRAYKTKKRTRLRQRNNGRFCGGGKVPASKLSSQANDPPSHSATVPKEDPDLGIIISEKQEQQPSSSTAESSVVPTSLSVSDKPSEESQKMDENESDSNSKTANNKSEMTTPERDRNDSTSSPHEQNQEPSADTNVKNRIPADGEKTGQKFAEMRKSIETNCPHTNIVSSLANEKAKPDIGVETAGISTSLLGMTIERQQQSATEASKDKNDQEDDARKMEDNTNPVGRRSKKYGKNKSRRSLGGVSSRTKYDCHVQSLEILSSSKSAEMSTEESHDDTTARILLDMYAYHQGREGVEARDTETGELLFTQQVSDTNHDFDAPKTTFPIQIEFPLEDEDDDDENCSESGVIINTERVESENKNFENNENFGNKNGEDKINSTSGKSLKKKDLAMYRETLIWDLLDPNTPTSLAYASAIAKEYGLSFGQTMDLAARIDKQIQKHVIETSHYREAIATREPIQELTQPRKLGPIFQPCRYDELAQVEKEGGTFRPKRESRGHSRPRSSGFNGVLKKNRNARIVVPEPVTKASTSERRDKIKKNMPSASDVNLEDEIDDDLLEEVRKRSTAELLLAEVVVLKPEKNAICHICKKRMPMGYHFPCPTNNHVYCDLHVQKRLGITKESGEYRYDSCPICTLACECAKCIRKLKNVATILKGKSIEQMKHTHDVDYPDILSVCTSMIPAKELAHATDLILEKRRNEIQKKRDEVMHQKQERNKEENPEQQPGEKEKKSRTIQLVGQTMVPRPPLSDFPRELHHDIDYDANATDAYFTVFSVEGNQSVTDVPDVWLDDENRKTFVPEVAQLAKIKDDNAEVPEDGNVDYCHICKRAGHLILCDFCPRGFHQDCLKNHTQSSPDGVNWECFVCKNEKVQSEKDFVDGKKSIDVISRAFLELDANDERAVVGLEVLSIIHQMLTNLLDYDFGYTFSEPVDTASVPGYTDIVKRPMDIGTICNKLENGDFSKLLEENFAMDDLVAKVLNDIELIWRNCIMFNVIGSSVARMALVLRRRVKMICRRSIFSKLSDKVKKNVSNYALKFDDAWASGITEKLSIENEDSISADNWKLSAIESMKPKSHYNFTAKPTNGRPVAILDSVSGRVVKLYSSAKSASKAVEIILKAGHRCEWNANASRTDLNCKLIAEKSREDPNSLLFGYRWLFLDDLNEGRVTFFKAVCDFIEMQHNNFTFVFRSIEEALSSSRLSKTVNINDLRSILSLLPRNGDWTEIEGVKWRRPVTPKKKGDSSKECIASTDEEDIEMGANLVSDSDSLPSWKNCSFLKKDLVTDQILVGFDSIQVALQDWAQTALSSPSFPSSEAQTMENFRKFYLDGDRNVDGMIWQSVENGHKMEVEETTVENTNNENLADIEIEDNGGSENKILESSDRRISKSEESNSKISMNESLSSSAANNAVTDDQQLRTLDNRSAPGTLEESPSMSGKRKCADDDDIDFPANKEARLSIVFVE